MTTERAPALGFHAPADTPRFADPEDRRTALIVAAALAASVAAAALVIASAPAGAQDGPSFALYSAPRNGGPAQMRMTLRTQPLPDLPTCYAIAALSIDELNRKNPDRDFMGRCGDGDLLVLRELSQRAMDALGAGR